MCYFEGRGTTPSNTHNKAIVTYFKIYLAAALIKYLITFQYSVCTRTCIYDPLTHMFYQLDMTDSRIACTLHLTHEQ